MNNIKPLFTLLLFFTAKLAGGQGILPAVIGEVTHSVTGEILADVHVYLKEAGKGTVTGLDGRFYFYGLQAGDYTLTIRHVGFVQQFFPLTISDQDSVFVRIPLVPAFIDVEEVVVTASRFSQHHREVAGRIDLISPAIIENSNSQSIDDLFQTMSGITVDRTSGIYSRSVVGIRGITGSEQGRVLALVDGIPLNKSDGGSVNWNRLYINDIERIEVFKGPGSSLYGSNAMGGVINIIRKRPAQKGLEGEIGTGYGTHNTMFGNFLLMGRLSDQKGLYWSASGRTRSGDGYIDIPDSLVTGYDTKSFLNEKGLNSKLGYSFTKQSFIELDYNYYDDLRGGGSRIFAEKGDYTAYKTHFFQGRYTSKIRNAGLDLNAYWQYENYLRQYERLRGTDYTLIHIDSERKDQGIQAFLNIPFNNHNLVAGAEYRQGSVDAADVYQTSDDVVINQGKMNLVSSYLNQHFHFESIKLRVQGGLRFDLASFFGGGFYLKNPTSVTNFMLPETGELNNSSWEAFTSRFSVLSTPAPWMDMYASFSQGFRPATLDDMTRSGLISIGFKRANPDLQPEKVDNYETGLTLTLPFGLIVEPGVYFSRGRNFMYYVSTGEQILVGTRSRTIYKKQNVTEVHISGIEADLKYPAGSHLSFFGNYTFTKSFIKSFEEFPDLVGRQLTYNPKNQVNAGVYIDYPVFSLSLKAHYQDRQFTDDENSVFIESFATADAKASLRFGKGAVVSLGVQNIFNKVYLRPPDQLSVGRFVTTELYYKF